MKITTRRGAAAGLAIAFAALTGCPTPPAAWECESVITNTVLSDAPLIGEQTGQACDTGNGAPLATGVRYKISSWIQRSADGDAYVLVVHTDRTGGDLPSYSQETHYAFKPVPESGIVPGDYDIVPHLDPTSGVRYRRWNDTYNTDPTDLSWLTVTDPGWPGEASESNGWLIINAIEHGAFDANGKAQVTYLNAQDHVQQAQIREVWSSATYRIGRPGA